MWLAVDGDPAFLPAADQTQRLFEEVWSHLRECGCEWSDAVLVYLYVADMLDYLSVNSVYKKYFSNEPPARCVSVGVWVWVRVWVCLHACVRLWVGGCVYVCMCICECMCK